MMFFPSGPDIIEGGSLFVIIAVLVTTAFMLIVTDMSRRWRYTCVIAFLTCGTLKAGSDFERMLHQYIDSGTVDSELIEEITNNTNSSPTIIALLGKAISHSDQAIGASTAVSLRCFKSPETTNLFMPLLKFSDMTVRSLAVESLAFNPNIPDRNFLLERYLSDGHEESGGRDVDLERLTYEEKADLYAALERVQRACLIVFKEKRAQPLLERLSALELKLRQELESE